MAHSYSKTYIHLIFRIKSAGVPLRKSDLPGVFAYAAGILARQGCMAVQVGGIVNHLHVLCTLPRELTQAKLAYHLKTGLTLWLKKQHADYRAFEWQEGYAAFSVGPRTVPGVQAYIRNQEQHHLGRTYAQELRSFLDAYGVEYSDHDLHDMEDGL